MRNLLWLLAILGCIGLGVKYQQSLLGSPSPRKDMSVSWQEWDDNGLCFSFAADSEGFYFKPLRAQSSPIGGQLVLPGDHELEPRMLGMVKETVPGSLAAELHAELREVVEIAVDEIRSGRKTRELNLREGTRTWTVEIGTRPGHAQRRIINIMEPMMVDYRNSIPKEGQNR